MEKILLVQFAVGIVTVFANFIACTTEDKFKRVVGIIITIITGLLNIYLSRL